MQLSFAKKITIILTAFLFLTVLFTSIVYLRKIYMPNIVLENKKTDYIYIKTNSTLEDVCNSLYEKNFLKNRNSFEWLAEKKGYDKQIKAGKYKISSGMSNNELINLLRSGRQERVRLSFNNLRKPEQIAGIFAKQLETDSLQIMELFANNEYLNQFGVTKDNAIVLFIPNTYYFFWNTSAVQVFKRMHNEFKNFWNEQRLSKAAEIGLSPMEVITLASIVDEESNMSTEYPTIAGVYLNRLKKGMPLQADPTVKFAVGDFGIKRILTKHIAVNSPYNTYRNKGLPPGPIAMPSIKAIDGVLNYQKHKYLYFCAKADFSGYHVFASNLVQHNANARLFQKELNRRKIYR